MTCALEFSQPRTYRKPALCQSVLPDVYMCLFLQRECEAGNAVLEHSCGDQKCWFAMNDVLRQTPRPERLRDEGVL